MSGNADAESGDSGRVGDLALPPGFVVDAVVRRAAKSLVVAGSFQGAPVVAKLLLDASEFWRSRFAREIDAYRSFRHDPPPIRTPRLVHADEQAMVLVLERIEGRTVAADRHPRAPVGDDDLAAVLATVGALNRWAPSGDSPFVAFDYTSRLDRYRGDGLFDGDDCRRLSSLLERLEGSALEFCHGDVLLNNFLRVNGECALLDWEFAGFYLPGFDLALLWTLLGVVPPARRQIEEKAGAGGELAWTAFVVNQAVVLTREIRIHRELPSGTEQEALLVELGSSWEHVRRQLAALTS